MGLFAIHLFLEVSRLLYKYAFAPFPWAISNDNKPIYEGLSFVRGVKYGNGTREYLDVFTPCPSNHIHKTFYQFVRTICEVWKNHGHSVATSMSNPVVLYVHGGGWIMPGSDVQQQQLMPFVRQGSIVYSMNYPLAPWARFPVPLLSVLRALHWLKAVRGHKTVRNDFWL
jgi:acetyl esterase/lipase